MSILDYVFARDVIEGMVAYGLVYLGIVSGLLLIAFCVWLARYIIRTQPSRESDIPKDFQPTMMCDFTEPRTKKMANGMFMCYAFWDGQRVLGTGKTPERARESYDRRLAVMVQEAENFGVL